ncbi:hypothetical protein CRUP_005610, partial [Coryphaenoides rupestris]
MSRTTKLMKGKVGKPKVKKVYLEETLPSPFGRRVEPPSQPMKSDPSKKFLKKKKGDPDLMLKLEFDEDGEVAAKENSSVSAAAVVKPKVARVKREKKEPGTPRVKKTPVPKGTPTKKVKKRNPWSDEESQKSDSELDESEPIIPRETKSQRASASKPKYTFDFSEEEEEE